MLCRNRASALTERAGAVHLAAHQTLKTTPAVAAGVADHVWTMAELVGLLERVEARPTGTDSN